MPLVLGPFFKMESSMDFRLWLCILIATFSFTDPVVAQQMPREDVVDVPAIGEGLRVSNVFQSNMVLQRDKPIHVWGWADPGEQVTVTFGGGDASAKAGDDRVWRVALPTVPANNRPQQMVVKAGDKSAVLDNILVGDVWVLGGQSNMEFELAKVENGQLEIISANFPEIRILTVPYGRGPELKRGFARLHEYSSWFGRHFRKGDWDECTPETARELSAIGYTFARRVHKAGNVPIGVIDASRGGTTVETWTPLPVLRAMDSESVRAKLAHFDNAVAEWDAQADLDNRIAQHRQWIERQTKEGKPIPDNRKQEPGDLRPGPIGNHNFPGHCYAGMISPLDGLSVKGAIFHQGYNNAFEGSVGVDMYRDVFPEMITAWRKAFNDPEMPFGILSLCTDGYPQIRDNYCEKMFNAGIDIRAAQYQSFLDFYNAGDKHIGFVSTYDLRRRWYHPQLKIPAGERIARWALATQYGFDRAVQWKPPMLESMEPRDGRLVLKLDTEVSDPQDGVIQGFAIAGEDRRFHPADASYAEKGKDSRGRIQYDRKQLVLTSLMVPDPIHFRYAWGRNPLANLQATGNKDLPFATQRSDDWKLEEVPLGVLGDKVALPISRGDRGKIIQALREQDSLRRLKEAKLVIEANSGNANPDGA
jgi:sialate O-acetylesterase